MHNAWKFRKAEVQSVAVVLPPGPQLVITLVKGLPDQPRGKDGKWASSGDDGTSKLTASQREEHANMDRQSGLSARDTLVESRANAHYVSEKAELLQQYKDTAKDGNRTVNVDAARPLFEKDGYHGTNSAAVQEASSALGKDVWKDVLNNPEGNAVLYAGGSGSGKTSAIESLLPDVKTGAAGILDGNLSKVSSAMARIKVAEDAGKDVHVIYAYRDPKGAWVDGVIKRMLDNPSENGRVVPLSTFLANTQGSLDTVRALQELSPSTKFTMIDNSLGKGNQQIMSAEKFASLKYDSPEKMRADLTKVTMDKYNSGTSGITKDQLDALLK